ncbi:putative ribonuclease [Streptomyces phage Coruscant]|uniref:Putative ribonuclease n=1 Tax=Streptomyces phage Coruscant TaxID=2739834 RepID=A0A7G4AVX2_9CAUD|nr:putative ribonuclease [Streptomyces phage Coruscant]QMP84162.1 putative ribonuclease [Streptomyces phage Coruscant]
MSDNESLRDKIDDLIEEWHDMYPDDNAVVSLHDFLGLTWKEYALFTEWDVLPGESVSYDKFEEMRDSRLAAFKDRTRYRDAIDEITSYVEPTAELIHEILRDHGVDNES